MDAEPCGAVNAQCDELVGKIASVSRMSRKDEYERAYKRLRKPHVTLAASSVVNM